MKQSKKKVHQGEATIRRRGEGPVLNNVISMRISDEELLLLHRMQQATSRTASDILRDAFMTLKRSPHVAAHLDG